jgi:hypothetical protein
MTQARIGVSIWDERRAGEDFAFIQAGGVRRLVRGERLRSLRSSCAP